MANPTAAAAGGIQEKSSENGKKRKAESQSGGTRPQPPKRQKSATSTDSRVSGLTTVSRTTSRTDESVTTTRNCKGKKNRRVGGIIDHPVLARIFPTRLTLRSYLISRIKAARRPGWQGKVACLQGGSSFDDTDLRETLDGVVVGLHEQPSSTDGDASPSPVVSQAAEFDRTQLRASLVGTGEEGNEQYEIVSISIQLLLRGSHRNVLTEGYAAENGSARHNRFKANDIFPYKVLYSNGNVEILKGVPWQKIHKIVGDDVMVELLYERSMFAGLGEGGGVYQLAGFPILEFHFNSRLLDAVNANPPLKPDIALKQLRAAQNAPKSGPKAKPVPKSPADIQFVRTRLFYSKPLHNRRGEVAFGLRQNHVLNRLSSPAEAAHILKYILPLEFGLHNVFTNEVNKKQTPHKALDYTDREEEIRKASGEDPHWDKKGLKRLKNVIPLVEKMQKLHNRCSYHALIKKYCPNWVCDEGVPCPEALIPELPESAREYTSSPEFLKTQVLASLQQTSSNPAMNLENSGSTSKSESLPSEPKGRYALHASTHAQVAAFAKACVCNVIPKAFWGCEGNEKLVMKAIERFVGLGKYEQMSLDKAQQDLKLTAITWLCPPSMPPAQKLSAPDRTKRLLLLSQFLYWLFDSFLIPLLTTNFFITDTQPFGNRIFYFRHDVWKKLTTPIIKAFVGDNMFEEVKKAKKGEGGEVVGVGVLESTVDGETAVGKLRLVPKAEGVRPIVNLKRRKLVKKKGGKMFMGASINETLTPLFRVLTFEKIRKSSLLGASIFNAKEVAPRLQRYKDNLLKPNKGVLPDLYFVKMDVTACYDTIPQEALLKMVEEEIIDSEEYRLGRVVEIKAPSGKMGGTEAAKSRSGSPVSVRSPTSDTNTSTSAGSNSKLRILKRPKPKWPFQYCPIDFAREMNDFTNLPTVLRSKALSLSTNQRQNSVYIPKAPNTRPVPRSTLLASLRQHITQNYVQINSKLYLQRKGIPQGSKLSSLLCNFFYAKLEREKLAFAVGDLESLLIRMTDDFLFITPYRHLAERFVQTLTDGVPEYGVSVNPQKSLTNFSFRLKGSGHELPVCESVMFPYVGLFIHTKTLALRRDYRSNKAASTAQPRAPSKITSVRSKHHSLPQNNQFNPIRDSITVSLTRSPLLTMQSKIIKLFLQKLEPGLLLDTEHNGEKVVEKNLAEQWRFVAERWAEMVRLALRSGRKVGVKGEVLIRIVGRTLRVGWEGVRERTVPRRVVVPGAGKVVVPPVDIPSVPKPKSNLPPSQQTTQSTTTSDPIPPYLQAPTTITTNTTNTAPTLPVCSLERRKILGLGIREFLKVLEKKSLGKEWDECRRWVAGLERAKGVEMERMLGFGVKGEK